MSRKWIANIVGALVFISMLVGANLAITLTSVEAFVTVLFAAGMAAYMMDQVDPKDGKPPKFLYKSQVSETTDEDPRDNA